MMIFKSQATATRKVEATAARTIRTISHPLARKIIATLNEKPDQGDQTSSTNTSLSAMIAQEDGGLLRIDMIALKLLRSVVYRSLRVNRMAAERLGISKVLGESLHDARIYAAGYIAGHRASQAHMRKKS